MTVHVNMKTNVCRHTCMITNIDIYIIHNIDVFENYRDLYLTNRCAHVSQSVIKKFRFYKYFLLHITSLFLNHAGKVDDELKLRSTFLNCEVNIFSRYAKSGGFEKL